MQFEIGMMRRFVLTLSFLVVVQLSVYFTYSYVGSWPPFWTAVVASYFLASAVWLLVALSAKAWLRLSIGKYPFKNVLTLMTTVAILSGVIRLIGFYPSLLIFSLGLIAASFVDFQSNQLCIFRRHCFQRVPRPLCWLPGFSVGAAVFAALHVYDLQVLLLNKGIFEFSLSFCILAIFSAILGAWSQLLVISVSRLLARRLRLCILN